MISWRDGARSPESSRAFANAPRDCAVRFAAIPPRRLRRGAQVADHDPKLALRDRKLFVEALTEALTDGDALAFKEILAAHLEVVQEESFYREAGLSRRTLYRMLGASGNPTLENIVRLVRAVVKSVA